MCKVLKKNMNDLKKRTFFDCLKVILNTKNKEQMELDINNPHFDSIYDKFMIMRYLSMHVSCLLSIKEIQQSLENLTNEQHYRFLFKVIPQKPRLFIKYISKKI